MAHLEMGPGAMFFRKNKMTKISRKPRGFLSHLARDTRGNALMIMAAAVIPLIGMVGGGIDISRMYIVKTRLQHACDAGALAGRKAMGGGTWRQSSYLPRTQAERFFDANIANNAFGSTSITRMFSESSGKVSGTASAVVPMTLMRVFKRETETLTVVCDAEMRLPNTDIMFVLDTTGSMAQNIPGESTSKMVALKKSVKCFYEIVARRDTNADCGGDVPTGGTGDQVQIRFGFVPYSTNVNVGRLLPTEWVADKWSYQSRIPGPPRIEYSWQETGRTSAVEAASVATLEILCTTTNAQATYGQPYREVESGSTKTGTRRDVSGVTYNRSTGVCSGTITTLTVNFQRQSNAVFDQWRYDQVEHDISKLKNGSEWNAGVALPIGPSGAPRMLQWDGCIEERPTQATTDFDPIPNTAYDLDLTTTPVAGDRNTLWGPALPGAIFLRQSTSGISTSTSGWNATKPVLTTAEYRNNPNYFCPTAARRLTSYPDVTDAVDFQNYVDSLAATGNTYHDIGLLWGARLMWPTGIFRADNEFTDRGGEIDRHIIFMTDGETNALNYDYTAYGLPWFDRRQTASGSVPSATLLNEQVNLRFTALCKAVKDYPKGITLWVINFGDEVGSTTKTRLSNCATSADYFFDAADSDELQTAFRKIADDISQLRLTK